MSTSVGTKTKKKQPSLSKSKPMPTAAPPAHQREKMLQSAMQKLDTACLMVLESEFAPPAEDQLARAARQRFINVASPVSLALMECKGGPRQFHHHYRHKPEDAAVLQPVFEDPVDTLALACREASKHCHEELLGLRDSGLRAARHEFQVAIQGFLAAYDAAG